MPPIEKESVFPTVSRTNSTATESKKAYNFEGFLVETDTHVRIVTGPVVGKVTTSSAVILLEVCGKSLRHSFQCQKSSVVQYDSH